MAGHRMGSRSTLLSAAALLLSAVALTLFFTNVGAVFGPINDVLISAFLLLLMPGLWAARARLLAVVGAWFTVLTLVAMLGMVVAATGQLLLVLRVISLQTSLVSGGLGFLPLAVWIGVASVVALRRGVLSTAVGWWGVAFIGITLVLVPLLAVVPMQLLGLLGGIPWFLALTAWLVALGRELGGPARQPLRG